MPRVAMLLAQTARRRYAVRRDDVLAIELIGEEGPGQHVDARGNAYIGCELGALIDPADCSAQPRRRALLVTLRRRMVALLVDHVELVETDAPVALPALLAERLRQPWAVAALMIDGELVVQLDIRALARSALLQTTSS
jgi:hypothetical protein